MTKRRFVKQTKMNISKQAYNGLSEHRREEILAQKENGILKEGTIYNSSPLLKDKNQLPQKNLSPSHDGLNRSEWIMSTGAPYVAQSEEAKCAIAHSVNYKEQIIKEGSCATSSGAQVDVMGPDIYSPLFTMANLNLPRDRIVINAWCRNFFALHPIVRNAITIHATYPISKLTLKCEDHKVLQFFEDMVEEMDLMGALADMALEFWKLGEVFPYLNFDENTGKWRSVTIHNPDYINVRKTIVNDGSEPFITLKPDASLIRMVTSKSPRDLQQVSQLPEQIIHHIKRGEDIPLDNFNVSHLKNAAAAYDVRGMSIIVAAFKDLMLYDKLRDSKFAQADGMINPITLIKVGGQNDYRASQQDLEEFKEMFEQAQYDRDFKLITHDGVTVERVGYSGQVLDIAADFEMIMNNIYTALMIPRVLIENDGAFSTASLGLEVLRQRYYSFRNMLANWIEQKVFAPISKIQGFYNDYNQGRKELIIPKIEWNKMNLYEQSEYVGNLNSLVGTKQASLQSLYKSLGLNYEEEQKKLRQEAIDEAIRLKEQQVLSTYSLSKLRAMDPESDVIEDPSGTDDALPSPPGMEGGEELASMPDFGGGDLGGGDLGGGDLGGGDLGGGDLSGM